MTNIWISWALLTGREAGALDTERQRVSTEQSLAQAQAMLTDDYVALQKSLGLGWQHAMSSPAPNG